MGVSWATVVDDDVEVDIDSKSREQSASVSNNNSSSKAAGSLYEVTAAKSGVTPTELSHKFVEQPSTKIALYYIKKRGKKLHLFFLP